MATQTALGRVQPLFKGTYNASTIYYKLDNVEYEGNTWVCVNDDNGAGGHGIRGITPANNNYWTLVAEKGNTGSFGTPTASAFDVAYGDPPVARVTATGPDTEKIFSFEFGIPEGPIGETGVQSVQASATGRKQDDSGDLQAGDPPWVTVELDGEDQELTMVFGIPPGHDGQGAVSSVDTIQPTNGNVNLGAVRYTVAQGLDDSSKTIARNNIGAQVAGNYIAEPSQASSGQFLQYSNEGEWQAATINLVPTGSSADIGKYLRKTGNGMLWADVQSLPAGGAEGTPLIKNSADSYDVTWGSFISSSMIDNIIDA